MTMLKVGAALAFALMLSSPAAAQDTDQQMIAAFRAPLPSSAADTAFAQQFGLCVAGKSSAKDVLRSLPASGTSDKSLFWMILNDKSCAGDKTYNFNPRALRGPLAEFYLKRDFDLVRWTPKRSPLKVFRTPTIGELDKLSADQRAGVVMLAIGTCVFNANRARVADLMRTSLGSPQEAAAFAALSPTLAGCVPAGTQLKATKFQLRGYLAEAAYRAAAEPPPGTS
jgi:hypothetical protein